MPPSVNMPFFPFNGVFGAWVPPLSEVKRMRVFLAMLSLASPSPLGSWRAGRMRRRFSSTLAIKPEYSAFDEAYSFAAARRSGRALTGPWTA